MRRVLFLGDRPLGSRCLHFLIRQPHMGGVCGVVSRDEEKRQWWGTSSIPTLCKKSGIPWFPLSMSLERVVAEVRPDMVISVLYPKIVPRTLVETLPCFNLHCAPLPEYGGWNATLWAILNGEEVFGVTLHQMTEGPDEGPLIDKTCFAIPPQITNIELYHLTHEDGYRLFCKYYPRLLSGTYSLSLQTGRTRYYSRRDLPSREIDLCWDLEKISVYARAFYFPPFEPAYVRIHGKKIWFVPQRAVALGQTESGAQGDQFLWSWNENERTSRWDLKH